MAQTELPSGSQTKMFEMTSRIADIDSSLRIDHYPLAQRRKLLAQLYEIDQRYRDSLVNGSKSVSKQQLFSHKLIANDQANRALLTKFINRFGWPTHQQYGDHGTFTAWLVVWHAEPDYQKRYYPLIKKAYQQGLIKQNPNELERRIRPFSK